jgi:dihydrolipoamide dehydrogenase
MEKRGITFKMKTAVENVADIDADCILMATGRKPRTPGYTNVDVNFRVSDGVYAIGDVNGKQMLAHAAEMQAVRAVNHILGKKDNIRFDIMPAAIFTEPEAACVGPTEDQQKEAGTSFECHKSFYRANGKALAMNETEGMVKLCCEPNEGRLLSAHIFGAHAADIVQEVTVYITLGATLRQLRDTVHIHPTLSEVLIEAN